MDGMGFTAYILRGVARIIYYWFHETAIQYHETIVQAHRTMFEFGMHAHCLGINGGVIVFFMSEDLSGIIGELHSQ